ncbi:hypothetical protein [Streptomyces sp. A012304]|nr:hypothetical protein [Streptomyces sp. A012304]
MDSRQLLSSLPEARPCPLTAERHDTDQPAGCVVTDEQPALTV